VPGPRARVGHSSPADSNELFNIATSFASGEEALGAIFDGKKGKRLDDAPAKAASPESPTGRTSGAKRGRSRAARRASRDATPTMARPLLLTQLDGALDRPLEVQGCSMTC
jgi:hypothetical protein